ncbi:hypothetical protein ACXR0O_07270 [Verrucomicrobiota bacterium sgz303538]
MSAFSIFAFALAGTTVGALATALYLQFATRIVAGFKPTYGTAYRASFLAGFLFAAGVALAHVAGVISITSGLELNLVTLLLFFVIHLCVYSGQLVHPDRGYVGMAQATVIVFFQNVIAVVGWSMVCWALHKPAPLDRLSPQWAELQARSFSKPIATIPLPATPAPITPIVSAPTFSTPAEAQVEAVRRFPDLGVAGTKLHSEFLTRYRRYQSEKPAYFLDAAWPVTLAEESLQAIR